MAWTTPKTDWQLSDYFNLDPDYARIKGNIEYLISLGNRLFGSFPTIQMQEYTMSQWPYADFLNNIVTNIQYLERYCYKPANNKPMRTYQAEQPGWNADDLNIIESNLLNIYLVFDRMIDAIPKLPIMLGVRQI